MSTSDQYLGLRRTAAFSLGIFGINIAISFLTTVLLARMLGVVDYAIYGSVIAHALILSQLVCTGWHILLIRSVTDYLYHREYSKLKGILVFSHLFVLLLSVAAGALLLAIYVFVGELDLAWWKPFLVCIPLIYMNGLLALNSGELKGFNRANIGQVPGQLLRPTFFLMFTALLALYLQDKSITAVMVAMLAATTSAVLFSGYFVKKARSGVSLPSVGKEYESKKWLTALFPMAVSGLLGVAYLHVGVLILEYFGSRNEISFFQPALQIAMLMMMGSNAIDAVLASKVRQQLNTNNKESLSALLPKMSLLSFSFAGVVAAVVFITGENLVSGIFGPEFAQAKDSLFFLVLGNLIRTVFGSPSLFLNLVGDEYFVTGWTAFSIIVYIVLAAFLTPVYQAVGVAFSFMVFQTLLSFGLHLRMVLYHQISAFVFNRKLFSSV